VAWCRNLSGPVSATDPVKGSKDSASLVVCTRKKNLVGSCGFFVSDVISGGFLGHLGPFHLALPKPLDGSISLKFLLETRLQAESFDTLDDLLEFRVEKL